MMQTVTPAISVDHPAAPMRDMQVLLLDDSRFDRQRIRRVSSRTDLALTLDEVGTLQDFRNAIGHKAYDLILVDYRLSEGDGLVAVQEALATDLNRAAALVMVTGDVAQETAVAALRSGCHEFLCKAAMTPDHLRHTMLHAMSLAAARREQANLRAIVRETMVAGLCDPQVQTALAKTLQHHSPPPVPPAMTDEGWAELAALLTAPAAGDEFIFH